MNTNLTFGKCLKYFITNLDIRMNRLAKSINVDNSLVSRWINEKRIPPRGTTYIDDITDYLIKNMTGTTKTKLINEYLDDFYSEDTNMDIRSRIKKILLETQDYSLACIKNTRLKIIKNNSLHNIEPLAIIQESDNYIHRTNINNDIKSINLSINDKVIFGLDNILTASIQLIQKIAYKKCISNDNIIYITLFNHFDITSDYNMKNWRNSLLRAIKNGWHLVVLIKINNHLDNLSNIINFMLPLVKTGKTKIHYFNKYETVTTERDLCIIPEIGVISIFPIAPGKLSNCCLYFSSRVVTDSFKEYINIILKYHTHSLIKYYTSNSYYRYYKTVVDTKVSIGNQYNYNSYFNCLLLSEELYDRLVHRTSLDNNEVSLSLQYYKKQSIGIVSNLKYYNTKDIYFSESIEYLLQGYIYLMTYSGVVLVTIEHDEIIELLNNIIFLLNTYEKYQIALIFKNASIKYTGDSYIIKERHAVISELSTPTQNLTKLRLSTNESMFVKACENSFMDIWSKIAPVNKDKEVIIAWFQNQINNLTN